MPCFLGSQCLGRSQDEVTLIISLLWRSDLLDVHVTDR